jgi:hypothetical protein
VDGARTLATIFFVLGWLALGLAGLVGLGWMASIVLSGGRGSLESLISALTTGLALIAASLTPFFCWAVLDLLLGLVDSQDELVRRTRRIADAMGATGLTTSPLTAVAGSTTRRLLSPVAQVVVPEQAPRSIHCPNCGTPNPTWRTLCANCQATLA